MVKVPPKTELKYMSQKAQVQEKQRKSVCCCLFASTPNGRRRWLGRRKTKSYYIVGIIPVQMDMASLKQISVKLSAWKRGNWGDGEC